MTDPGVKHQGNAPRTRGVALWEDLVIANLPDGRVIAIKRDNGEIVWDKMVATANEFGNKERFHAAPLVNFAVVAKAPLPRVVTFAEERGWRHLRVLSSASNTYNRDYLAETPDGDQRPMLNVFHRYPDGVRHSWGSELFYAPSERGQDPRHVGTLEPLWNLLDMTPEGRPADWDEQLSYG